MDCDTDDCINVIVKYIKGSNVVRSFTTRPRHDSPVIFAASASASIDAAAVLADMDTGTGGTSGTPISNGGNAVVLHFGESCLTGTSPWSLLGFTAGSHPLCLDEQDPEHPDPEYSPSMVWSDESEGELRIDTSRCDDSGGDDDDDNGTRLL